MVLKKKMNIDRQLTHSVMSFNLIYSIFHFFHTNIKIVKENQSKNDTFKILQKQKLIKGAL